MMIGQLETDTFILGAPVTNPKKILKDSEGTTKELPKSKAEKLDEYDPLWCSLNMPRRRKVLQGCSEKEESPKGQESGS